MHRGDVMCPVCRRELDRFFEHFSGRSRPFDPLPYQRPCPEKWRGDGFCDACLEPADPDC